MPLEVGLRIDRVVPFMTVGGILQIRRFLATMDTGRVVRGDGIFRHRRRLGGVEFGIGGIQRSVTVLFDELFVGTGQFVTGDGWATGNPAWRDSGCW
ncbi:hypothetical protein BSKO_02809 [Bryopsis sp. KO-2023]|nr:hypothetical protein BSKO_02809 [Bryopsis sp. KO-2023]